MNIITKLRQKIKSRAQQGKAFETMIRASLKRLSEDPNNKLWFTRLYDYRSFIRLNPMLKAIKQPGDFLVCYYGRFCVIECKSSQANRFNPENVRPNQVESMKEIYNSGGKYWLLILHRGESKNKHELFAYNYMQWLQLLVEIKRSSFKTASWKDVATFATLQLTKERGVWDLVPLFTEHDTREQTHYHETHEEM